VIGRACYRECVGSFYLCDVPTRLTVKISEKGPDMVRFFRTMSGQWFFRSTFFGLFLRKRWTKGGPSNVVGP
jgi:hypothetical protein